MVENKNKLAHGFAEYQRSYSSSLRIAQPAMRSSDVPIAHFAVLCRLPASTSLCKITTSGEHLNASPTSRGEMMPSLQARSYPPERCSVAASCRTASTAEEELQITGRDSKDRFNVL